jgi:16S rRNA (adenine(1408)-N(1))-methyltransferase
VFARLHFPSVSEISTNKTTEGRKIMERVLGKYSCQIDAATLAASMEGYAHRLVDIGAGDGRFVLASARGRPAVFALGIDACRENLRAASRRAPGNAFFVIANALALPFDLDGIATHITINFPWGSLLEGLLTGEATLLHGLAALCRPGARLDVRLNGGALAAAGWTLEAGAAQIRWLMCRHGFALDALAVLGPGELRRIPTTWAKRLAFGRDPRAMALSGVWEGLPVPACLTVR